MQPIEEQYYSVEGCFLLCLPLMPIPRVFFILHCVSLFLASTPFRPAPALVFRSRSCLFSSRLLSCFLGGYIGLDISDFASFDNCFSLPSFQFVVPQGGSFYSLSPFSLLSSRPRTVYYRLPHFVF